MSRTIIDPSLTPTVAIGYQNVPNIVVNGGFEVWQRGNTFNNVANGTFVSDHWKHDHSSSVLTCNITRETTIKDGGSASLKMDVTAVTSGTQCTVYQYVENVTQLSGKTISVSARVRTNVGNKIRLELSDATSASYSAYHSGSGQFETLTVTRTMGTTTSIGDIHTGCGFNSDTVVVSTTYIDSFMMVIGGTAVNYVPDDPEIELARCQRYFEKSYAQGTAPGTATTSNPFQGIAVNGTGACWSAPINYVVEKRTFPTVTLYDFTGATGSWSWSVAGAAGTNRVTTPQTSNGVMQTKYFSVRNGVTATDNFCSGHWTSDADF